MRGQNVRARMKEGTRETLSYLSLSPVSQAKLARFERAMGEPRGPDDRTRVGMEKV